MKSFLRGYCRILLFVLMYSRLNAQQLPVTLYSSGEGSFMVGAASVFQDKQGWIWCVSGYDVMRYDGHRFKSYPPSAKTKINYVFGLMEVKDETWVLGYPGHMKISGDSIETLSAIDSALSFQHSIIHNGKTCLLEQRGLYLYDHDSLKTICRDNLIKAAVIATLIPYDDSVLLSFDANGRLIVFDLYKRSIALLSMQITDMQRDAEGNIFLLVNGNGFYRLRKIHRNKTGFEADTELYYPMPDKNIRLGRFTIDRGGNIWAYEQLKRLVRISPLLKLTSYTEDQGLPGLVFNNLLVDREDNLWIAFNGGICKINTGLWERLTKAEGLVLNHITLLAKDGSTIFLGTQDGMNVYRNEQVLKLTQHGKPFICNSFLSENQKLWYSRETVLYIASLDPDKAKVIAEKKLATLPVRIQELKKDTKGTIFIGTNGGLYAWYVKRLLKPVPDSLHFRKIIIDKRNQLWLGQFSGPLDHYAIEYHGTQMTIRKVETIIAPPEMPALETIRALEEDQNGNIVVGTRYNGLFHVTVKDDKVSSVKHFDTKDGLSSKSIWGIAIADDGRIWISTARGLNTIQFTGGKWVVADEGRQRNIYETSGVLFDQARQRLWVNNHPGIIYFDATKQIPSYPFSVNISVKTPGAKDFNDKNNAKAGSWFSYRENNFSFEFSANSYQNEKAIQYTYRLIKNGDGEWSVPSATHNINFSSLNPGNYVLHVKAMNANNGWSSNEAVYEFRISPPFWQRPWFIVLLILFVAAGFYTVYRYRIRKMKELFEIRQVIASDLHDEIGSSLTSIHILSKISQNNVANDQQKAFSLLEKVIDQSGQIQQNMSDIVWAITPDNDKMENMIMRMREYLNYSLEPKNITIDFIAEEKLMSESLPMEQRRDVLLIFKEAVNNIAKYSQCKLTHIRLDRLNRNIRMVIEDDGIGFDLNHATTSSGIKNMQRRAGLMKGSIRINSAVGKGTRIELLVPVA